MIDLGVRRPETIPHKEGVPCDCMRCAVKRPTPDLPPEVIRHEEIRELADYATGRTRDVQLRHDELVCVLKGINMQLERIADAADVMHGLAAFRRTFRP
jgi:hypothetical protein